jgi:hypothetical protein
MADTNAYRNVTYFLTTHGHQLLGKIGQRAQDDDEGEGGGSELRMPQHPILGEQRAFDGIPANMNPVIEENTEARRELQHQLQAKLQKQLGMSNTNAPVMTRS